jgi:hypothetical protein
MGREIVRMGELPNPEVPRRQSLPLTRPPAPCNNQQPDIKAEDGIPKPPFSIPYRTNPSQLAAVHPTQHPPTKHLKAVPPLHPPPLHVWPEPPYQTISPLTSYVHRPQCTL